MSLRSQIHYLCLPIFLILAASGCQSLEENLEKRKSPYADERIEAIDWLFHNASNVELKEALQNDSNEVVRSMAARLMALDGSKEFIPFLEQALQDESYLVRMEAVQSLGSLQAEEMLPQLRRMLSPKKEPNLWVRLKVLRTLEYMKSSDLSTLKDIVEALEDPEPTVRFQAFSLLEKFTGEKMKMDREDWKIYLRKLESQS